jgi:hypothetical protein
MQPPIVARTLALGLVLVAVWSCGARNSIEDVEGGGDETDFCEEVILDADAGTVICGDLERCSISGALEDGRSVEITCTTAPDCRLRIDGVETCVCPQDRIDWGNVCPNGAPTCAGWIVDYTRVDYCLN